MFDAFTAEGHDRSHQHYVENHARAGQDTGGDQQTASKSGVEPTKNVSRVANIQLGRLAPRAYIYSYVTITHYVIITHTCYSMADFIAAGASKRD